MGYLKSLVMIYLSFMMVVVISITASTFLSSWVAVLVGFLDGGNAPFQRLFETDVNREGVTLNLDRLRSVLTDYKDRLLKGKDSSKALFFGYRPTVLMNEEEVLKAFENDGLFCECIEVSGTPREAIESAAGLVESVFKNFVE